MRRLAAETGECYGEIEYRVGKVLQPWRGSVTFVYLIILMSFWLCLRCLSRRPDVSPVPPWTRLHCGRGERVHCTHAPADASNDRGLSLAVQLRIRLTTIRLHEVGYWPNESRGIQILIHTNVIVLVIAKSPVCKRNRCIKKQIK